MKKSLGRVNIKHACACSLVQCWLFFAVSKGVSAEARSYGNLVGEWKVSYAAPSLRFHTDSDNELELHIFDVNLRRTSEEFYFELQVANAKLAKVDKRIKASEFVLQAGDLASWQGNVSVRAQQFGYTQLYVVLRSHSGAVEQPLQAAIDVEVTRGQSSSSRVFELATGAIVLLMFLNLGTVLDLQRLRQIVLLPIAPGIGFVCRYLVMPVVGLGTGYLLFDDNKSLQLALFFTALSPSGGLANICTIFFKGNIDLSIAVTTLNSLMALAMLPAWIFLLARVVYEHSTLVVPFLELAVSFIALMLALICGILMRFFLPKTTALIGRFLKPLSMVLSICLVALTVGIHIFTFRELTPMIVCAALCMPLLAYGISYGLAKVARLSSNEAMTLAIETSVMNMTVPILLLKSSLDSTSADMMIVVPIMCALMSMLLLVLFYFGRRAFYSINKKTYLVVH